MRRYFLNRKFVLALALWAGFLGILPSSSFAFPSESLSLAVTSSAREAQVSHILSVLSRPEAQVHLRLMGVHQDQIEKSLSKLDDSQLQRIAEKADAVKVGGDGLGIIIALLVIVLLVVLIVNLTGKKIVVKEA